ncbi:Ferric hydroxamate uptake [Delftia tsuruhatensis]|uniref:TonB-dependent siderophore receptor n=1 Tax=Delftia tsuruhatensis TaxID=180282 RepID=UPI001E7A8CF6|nr:TonB-dependent receptor [Delftia tsuruhatensis]CAB5695223.1 Ferric hydroxamate uptake [Delftia tsuruhatensis]CAC9686974.1 Ferric hydroxamate uptake [Delftia tsuruhatensis]
MQKPFTPTPARAALTCLLAAAVGFAAASHAADRLPAGGQVARAYQIGAGPLASVLGQFAAAAGVALSYDPASTRQLQSGGLRGSYTVVAGFAIILAGSGLEAVEGGTDEFIVRRAAPPSTRPGTAAAPSDAAELPAVRVVARAAPAPVDADERYQPTPDASSLRTTAPALEIPQVVNVVPAQVIRDQRPRTLDEALAGVSGVTQGNTLASTQDTIMKRGFGANRDGSVMHNGMPLVQGRGMNAAAESVEVIKGPSSLLYGLMDPGGVINVVSKKPQLRQRTALSLQGSGYAGGRDGTGATLDATGPLGSIGDGALAYRLIVDHVDEDYWRNFGQHRETLVAPSLAWYGDDTQAVLWYEYRKYLTPFDRGTALDPVTRRPLDLPATRRLDEPFNQMTGETHLAQLSVDHRLDNGWATHLNLSYNREIYDANQLRVNGVDTVRGTLLRSNDATHGALSTDSYGSAYVDGSLQWAGMRHDLQFGADAEYRLIYRSELLRQAVTSTFSYRHPIYGLEQPSATVSASDSDQRDQLHNQSLFVQDAIHLGDRWVLTAGLRYQSWRQTAGRGRPFKANTQADGTAWLPRAGLVYKLDNSLSLYASYSQSLRPTSTIAPLASGTVIDSGVAPEEAGSWEIGAKLDLPGQLTGTLALFDIRKRNVLVSQFNDATKLTDWRTSGAARSRGLEVDVAGELGRRWSAIAAYAHVDARTTQDPLYQGNPLWNVARQTASLSAVYDFGQVPGGAGRLRLGGSLQYVGKRPGDSANSFWLPGYTVAHGFATYDTRINGYQTRFQLNVKNLLDRTYYPSSANTYFISMGDARQVLLRATVEF